MSEDKRVRKISSALQPPNFGDGHLATIDEGTALRKVSHDNTGNKKASTGLRRISREQQDASGRKVSTFSVMGRKTSTYVAPEKMLLKQV